MVRLDLCLCRLKPFRRGLAGRSNRMACRCERLSFFGLWVVYGQAGKDSLVEVKPNYNPLEARQSGVLPFLRVKQPGVGWIVFREVDSHSEESQTVLGCLRSQFLISSKRLSAERPCNSYDSLIPISIKSRATRTSILGILIRADERASRSIFFFFLPLSGLPSKSASMGIMSFKATNQINGDRKGLANQNGNFPLLEQAMRSKINAHFMRA